MRIKRVVLLLETSCPRLGASPPKGKGVRKPNSRAISKQKSKFYFLILFEPIAKILTGALLPGKGSRRPRKEYINIWALSFHFSKAGQVRQPYASPPPFPPSATPIYPNNLTLSHVLTGGIQSRSGKSTLRFILSLSEAIKTGRFPIPVKGQAIHWLRT